MQRAKGRRGREEVEVEVEVEVEAIPGDFFEDLGDAGVSRLVEGNSAGGVGASGKITSTRSYCYYIVHT